MRNKCIIFQSGTGHTGTGWLVYDGRGYLDRPNASITDRRRQRRPPRSNPWGVWAAIAILFPPFRRRLFVLSALAEHQTGCCLQQWAGSESSVGPAAVSSLVNSFEMTALTSEGGATAEGSDPPSLLLAAALETETAFLGAT